jgi:hypothetical protein
LCARRAAWEDYVSSAESLGTLDADVASRLTGRDDENFRGAMAECMTAWLLTSHLRLPVAPRPDGRGRSIVDFGIQSDGDLIRVEVKSPYTTRPDGEGAFWSGDYKHLIEGSLDEANRQFSHDHTNVLMLVPLVEFPILAGRGPFVRAFYGAGRSRHDSLESAPP